MIVDCDCANKYGDLNYTVNISKSPVVKYNNFILLLFSLIMMTLPIIMILNS